MAGPVVTVQRRRVWSLPLRWCHWSLAAATCVLLLTGWLMAWAPERAHRVSDIHYAAAALLVAALAVRLGLLFTGGETDTWRALWPTRHRLEQGGNVLRSYLTLGRIPLPRWYAHNPLWAPMYLLLFMALAAQVVTGGLLLEDITRMAGVSVRELHRIGWRLLLGFTLAHTVAVFFHEAKGHGSAEISGMVDGQRCFTVARTDPTSPAPVVPLEVLTSSRRSKRTKP